MNNCKVQNQTEEGRKKEYYCLSYGIVNNIVVM